MTKGYPYDEDEFDAPVDPDGPHGVHRAPRSFWSKWWPFLAVIVVVPALTFAAVYWAMQDDSTGTVDDGAGTTVTVDGDDTDPGDGGTDGTDGTDPTDEPTDPVDPTAPILTTQVMLINNGTATT
ncbi:MAG: hypothetical protein FWD11_11180, partial [Micrococcales bacterium]|nr:hypothetical protein [Micrococcales bacterium]